MENLNIDSAQVISQLASAIERDHSSSKILAASFKNVAQVNRAFKEGTQAITAGQMSLKQLLECFYSKSSR